MFRAQVDEDTIELVFDDSLGRECAIAGIAPGKGEGGLMFGLRKVELLAEVDGNLTVLRTEGIGVVGDRPDDVTLLRGAPMALSRDMAAAIIPILRHYAQHGTMPHVIALGASGDPDSEGN